MSQEIPLILASMQNTCIDPWKLGDLSSDKLTFDRFRGLYKWIMGLEWDVRGYLIGYQANMLWFGRVQKWGLPLIYHYSVLFMETMTMIKHWRSEQPKFWKKPVDGHTMIIWHEKKPWRATNDNRFLETGLQHSVRWMIALSAACKHIPPC